MIKLSKISNMGGSSIVRIFPKCLKRIKGYQNIEISESKVRFKPLV